MIIVITAKDKDKYGNEITIVSHGVDDDLNNICLPQEDIRYCDFIEYHPIHGFIIKENNEKS